MNKWFIIFMTVSCQTSQISRPIPMPDSSLQVKNTSKGEQAPRASKELFAEKKSLKLEKKPINTTGSLFATKSPSAYLFTKKIPYLPGDYLTLKVEPVSANGKGSSQNQAQNSGETTGNVPPSKDTDVSADPLTTELTAAMPNLGPEDGSDGKVLPEIEAEVIDRTPEGDLIVRAHRSSSVDNRRKDISFEATIPARVAADSTAFSTKDLRSVTFAESGPEAIRRSSTGWNDEFSLRYSGFTETGSKNARQLADDKKKLLDVRDRLDGRIKAFAADRSRFAKERTKFMDERTALDSKLSESERIVKDKEAYIAKLESELSQAKNAPGTSDSSDSKEGSNSVVVETPPNSGSAKPQDPRSSMKPVDSQEKTGDQNVAKQ